MTNMSVSYLCPLISVLMNSHETQTDGEELSQHPQCPEGLFFTLGSVSVLGSRAPAV